MTTVTINGNTYSADGSSAKDMLNGGHRTWFIPLVSDVATVAGVVAGQAAQTAIDATNAANGAAATRGTSTTSLTIAAGSTGTITTQSGKQFVAGNYVTISRTSAPTTLMHGVVTSYSGSSLVVDVSTIAGSGTHTDWTIALSGATGESGPSGNGVTTYTPKTGAYTVVATDRGSMIDCTSGTFTLAFQACASLGADWSAYIRNSGTGVITLDPNGSETIDGAANYEITTGKTVFVQCDGSVLHVVFDSIKQSRLPIFSASAAAKTPVSVLEDISPPTYSTANGAGNTGHIVFGNSLFIAASQNASTNVATSPDAVTWTLRAMPSSLDWKINTNGTNKFIATAPSSTATASSTNGTTWASATVLPGTANSSYGRPAFIGDLCLVFAAAATKAYTSSDNAATWSAAQTLPAAPTSNPFVIGGLFWYFSSATTAYTSATGATGSWTARTLPITPVQIYIFKQVDGSLSIANSHLTDMYSTTDGINWSLTSTNGSGIVINGVCARFSSTALECATLHNGVWAVRKSLWSILSQQNQSIAHNGAGIIALPFGSASVARFDSTGTTPNALFEA